MTREEIDKMRAMCEIPLEVLLHLIGGGEHVRHHDEGWSCFYEYQLRCGLSFPIPRQLQYLLSCLNVAIGQLSPNTLKQIMGILCCGGYVTRSARVFDEFNYLYKLQYSKKAGDGGYVNFKARGREDLILNIHAQWRRSRLCMVSGTWQNLRTVHRVPFHFQPIVEQSSNLSPLEWKRIHRLLGKFPRGKGGGGLSPM
ncbi:hypothetical protein RchiOBHm_Chr2g0084191 [Rosa chinensis]|uniref:Uncharacterized protein n=1 Tax=Rosa chinensis TaxID=74649 RepID=A0A2P6RHU2_ROSCH|nr:hypothetical protein RchiOBHm_Chr2g0084191 [Rosa chinensis]